MISRVRDNVVEHTRFCRLPDFLAPGDVLVVNASATINAAFEAEREARDGGTRDVMLHLSTPLHGAWWLVEVRRRSPNGTAPLLDAAAGERIHLTSGGTAQLVAPYQRDAAKFSS